VSIGFACGGGGGDNGTAVTRGELVALDPALLVVPPKGKEVGHVPIVTRQERAR
jgi:hypothetical protein